MKDGDAIMATTLLRMKQEGYRPSRDIILALTADEEGGCCNGVNWLLQNHRELIDAEFVLNHDGFSVMSEHGVPRVFELGATEKVYADYQLVATNKGGHSSRPRPDNAIYELAAGLTRISKFQFPFELNNVTRAYFEQLAAEATGEEGAHMRGILKSPPDRAPLSACQRRPATVRSCARPASRPARGRPRQQCPATARPGECELPHPARTLAGGGAAAADRGAGRPEDHRALRCG